MRLPAAWRAELLAHAAAGDPAEVCGLIVGRMQGDGWVGDELLPCANVADEPRVRFEVDPKAVFDCLRRARGTSQALIGVYHSHPAGRPAPSATDAARAWDPDLVWLIIGGGEIKAWRPAAGGFSPVELIWEGT